ncbi:MAG: hypothetical protein KAY37_04675 [Phycisphaerae bacterium]|nr:hypothetical protein [Phycisphaerae bacterium]
MNLAVTIPQLFYDLIARVLPGFLFLVVLDFGLRGTGFAINQVWDVRSDSSVAALFGGLGYLVICYFCGWFLGACRWPNIKGRIHQSCKPADGPSLSTMYQQVRLQHPASGFRLVKLRAEGRMLGAARTGLWITVLVVAAAWLLATFDLIATTKIGLLFWIMRLALPLATSIAFLSVEPHAWRTYYGNIKSLHRLVIEEKYPK